MEEGETLEQGVIREVREENGFGGKITDMHFVKEVFFSEKEHHTLIISFFVNIISESINIMDPDQEIIEIR